MMWKSRKKTPGTFQGAAVFIRALWTGRLLKPGESDFNQLKDICLIIIAPFDIFGYEKYQYTFEMRCREVPQLAMEDGATRIFLNTHGKNSEDVSPELVELLYYMEHSNQRTSVSYQSSRVRGTAGKRKHDRRK